VFNTFQVSQLFQLLRQMKSQDYGKAIFYCLL